MSDPGQGHQGGIDIGGSVSGHIVVLGHGNRVEVHEQGSEEVSRQLLELGAQLSEVLRRLGSSAEIVPSAHAPSQGTLGTGPGDQPVPLFNLGTVSTPSLPTDAVETATRSYAPIDQLLQQLDQRLDPQKRSVQAIQFGETRFSIVDLLVQQGNLALWRFRQAYARLFGHQVTALLLALLDKPAAPELQAFIASARTNIDVLRSMALFDTMAPQRGDLLPAADDQLSRGQWRQVIDAWVAQHAISAESGDYLRTAIAAIGEPYRPEEVRAAHIEAEARFTEALRRHPLQSTAMINLAQLQAESAMFTYIESGQPDRPRLQRAHTLFSQARDLLQSQHDRDSQVALGKCLLYAGACPPVDVALETVAWAAAAVQLRRTSYSQQAQATVRWDIVQRNLASRDPSFVQVAVIQQARDLFIATGETVLAEQCTRNLHSLEQMRATLPRLVQHIQSMLPIVGTWRVVGGNQLIAFQGVVVFESEGLLRWQVDVQGLMPLRSTIIGQYQLMGRVIQVQGQRWNQAPGMGAFPMPFIDQLLIQGGNGTQLAFVSQQEGLQCQCQRM